MLSKSIYFIKQFLVDIHHAKVCNFVCGRQLIIMAEATFVCLCVRERKAPGYDHNRGAERREKTRDRKERHERKKVRRREI